LTWTAQDYQFMSRAIQLARRGRYTCDPNPRVGCVISKNAQNIAEGWHAYTGEAHAEINALNQCDDASDSTIYITLEPCSHHGRTPPCVEALIKAKVKQVIVAMLDPNPLVAGSGIKQLQNAGINVRQGLLEAEATKLNPGFIKRMTSALPYVRCKMAMSLDGRTALENGDSQWISSEQARYDVHHLRAASSAILTSVETIIKDDASLNARDIDFEVTQPVRVIIDRHLKIQNESKIFGLPGKIIIYTEEDNDRVSELNNESVQVITITKSESWLEKVFTHLAKKFEINEVMVEAGATLSGAIIETGLVDELIIYMASMLLGDKAQSLLKLNPLDKLSEARKLELTDCKQVGKDLKLTYNCL
jgi:diaminohydroxyphosphoribosylaminopyrimidine deaminase / 5-amino-6-(5-phosphoribosylamino)uracil reductase